LEAVETKDQRRSRIDVSIEDFTDNVASVIPDLMETKNYQKKREARRNLVHMGKMILPLMNKLLTSKNLILRKEASKVIELIGDKESIPTLIRLLDDENGSIRWIAAEGLIHVGRDSIVPLLEALFKCTDTYYVKLGAHHVFTRLFSDEEKSEFRPLLLSLRRYNNVAITAPIEAYNALSLFSGGHKTIKPSSRKYEFD
jgi:HEAT repeat protein